MFFQKEIVTNGRVIILDEPLSREVQEITKGLQTIDGQELVFLEDQFLATGLEEILEKISYSGTLLVFPGNGSGFPSGLSQVCQEIPSVNVHAKRFWVPGADPEVNTGLICPERFLVLGVKNIVVVDDVISSGLTMRRLYQNNAWRIPRANWHACSWVSQILPSGSIRGYSEVSTACLVRRVKGTQKVPINSLSTLRKNLEISTSYACRHFKNPDEFRNIIQACSALSEQQVEGS